MRQAYTHQTRNTPFDARNLVRAALGAIPKHRACGIMKAADYKVGGGKDFIVIARFCAMTGCLLFRAVFSNRAASW